MSASSIDLDSLLRRLHLPTVRRLYRELEVQAEKESMPHRDYLATLIAEEVAHRAQTRISRSTRKAHFPFLATIESFDFTFQSSIRLSSLGSLLGPELVSEGRCAIFYGNSGTGKTHLAIAVAYRAIQNGFEARFVDADALLEQLSRASQRDQLAFALEEYLHPHVLVIDEVGYLNHRADAANVLFQVVNARHLSKRSTIFTTNKPLGTWGRVLHDADLAEAIIDRVLERGRLITLNGSSFRTRHMANELRGARSSRASQIAHTTGDDDPELPSGVVEHGARISGKRGPELTEPTAAQDVEHFRDGGVRTMGAGLRAKAPAIFF
jgi:DNA replication protein DnaC